MRLLFRDAQFGEPLQNFMSFNFQLPCQLIDANLLHSYDNLRMLRALLFALRVTLVRSARCGLGNFRPT